MKILIFAVLWNIMLPCLPRSLLFPPINTPTCKPITGQTWHHLLWRIWGRSRKSLFVTGALAAFSGALQELFLPRMTAQVPEGKNHMSGYGVHNGSKAPYHTGSQWPLVIIHKPFFHCIAGASQFKNYCL